MGWRRRSLGKKTDMIEQRYREALEWQIGVWSRMSNVYVREVDRRLAPVVEAVIQRARLMPGENVL